MVRSRRRSAPSDDFPSGPSIRRGGRGGDLPGALEAHGEGISDPAGREGSERDQATPGREGGGHPKLGPGGERPSQCPPGQRQRQGEGKNGQPWSWWSLPPPPRLYSPPPPSHWFCTPVTKCSRFNSHLTPSSPARKIRCTG